MAETETIESQNPERPVEAVLDTIGDEYARDVLAIVCRGVDSAAEIADELDHSIQTVYRRLNLLEEHALIDSRTQLVADGNHHQVFEATFESVVISVADEEYDVRIYRQGDLPDRFATLWDDLSPV